MAVARTTTTSVGHFVPSWWDTLLGTNLYPNLMLFKWGEKRTIPRNNGFTIKIPRLLRRSVSFTALTAQPGASDGLINTGVSGLSSQIVSGTLKMFEFVYRHSDVVLMTAMQDVVELSIKEIARHAALTVDTHIRNQISLTGKFLGGSGAASGAVKTTSIIKASDILKGVVLLDGQNNPRYPGGRYPLVTHPLALYDLQSTLSSNAWVEINKYASREGQEMLYNAAIGSVYGADVYTSSNIKRLSTVANSGLGFSVASNSGYRSMMFAPQAFFVTEIAGEQAQVIVKPLGSAGTADPTNKVSTVAAKLFFQCLPANWTSTEYRMIRLIHGSNVS